MNKAKAAPSNNTQCVCPTLFRSFYVTRCDVARCIHTHLDSFIQRGFWFWTVAITKPNPLRSPREHIYFPTLYLNRLWTVYANSIPIWQDFFGTTLTCKLVSIQLGHIFNPLIMFGLYTSGYCQYFIGDSQYGHGDVYYITKINFTKRKQYDKIKCTYFFRFQCRSGCL